PSQMNYRATAARPNHSIRIPVGIFVQTLTGPVEKFHGGREQKGGGDSALVASSLAGERSRRRPPGPVRAKGGRIQLIHGAKPEGSRSRPPDRPGVATPGRSSQALSRFGTPGHARGPHRETSAGGAG